MFHVAARARAILTARDARGRLGVLAADRRGVAAIEFALFAGILSVAVLNVVDISIYIYQRMEVENATQMGAQAAFKTCGVDQLPATVNCPGLSTAVASAIHSTSLGTGVQLQSGSPSEGFYCVNASGGLQYVSNVSSQPADCSGAGMASLQPALYLQVQTTFAYSPLFPGMTVAGTFTTPITKSTLMRMQ
jgi:Flp pilus assembly protein TadG